MARTRLRGLAIGGIQIGIEVPENCVWDWPDQPISEYQCLPRDPEVHVGVRVADLDNHDLGGECYSMGSWTFEVARRGSDWQLGLSQGGRRVQLATFDREFLAGEVILSEDSAASRAYPLRGPLDEWIVLHRTVARGGLCLTARAVADGDQAVVRLGVPDARPEAEGAAASSSILGHNAILLREERGHIRLFRTPWSESIDSLIGFECPVREFQYAEAADRSFIEVLDPQEAAESLVTHAVVPLCDDGLLDRVLRNANRIAGVSRIVGIGEAAESDAPMAWNSPQLQGAFAPPREGP